MTENNFESNDNTEPNIQELIMELRQSLGQKDDLEMFTQEEVEQYVSEHFDHLPVHQHGVLVEAFLKSESDAAAEADTRAGQTDN